MSQRRMVKNIFVSLNKIVCFVVAIFDLVHDVEAMFHIP